MGKIKDILLRNNNWLRYKTHYSPREVEIQEVEKMLKCGDPENGFVTYQCPNCNSIKTIGFRCKSRICTSCGKIHADEWAIKLSMELYDVTHRHLVFTIPDTLRDVFEKDRKLLRILMDSVNQTMKQVIDQRRRERDVTPGVICVLHPYGKDLKFNPHVHVLATEGGLDSKNQWCKVSYFPYDKLRKIWQYHLLTNLKGQLKPTEENSKLIDTLFNKHQNGFYIYAKKKITKPKDVAQYIGRYVRHPAIAESRIINYDDETVTFFYEQNGKRTTVKMPVMEFIDSIVKHIPERHFKMIRYYGLYSRNKKKRVKQIMIMIGRYNLNKEKYLKKQLKRVRSIVCDECGSIMEEVGKTFPT